LQKAKDAKLEGLSRTKRYIWNVLWSWAGVATTLLLGFVLSPYTIRKIGELNFSVWTLALSLVEYYWLIDFGFRSATIRFSAESLATRDEKRLNELISTGVVWTLAAGLVVMTGSYVLAPQLGRLFHIEQPAFVTLVRMVGASWGLGMVSNIFSAVLEGAQRFDLTSRVWLIGMLVRSAGLLALLAMGYGVLAMGYMLLVSQIGSYVLTFVWFMRVVPQVRIHPALASTRMLGEMARYGIHTFTTLVAQLMQGRSAPLLIAYFLPLQNLAYYSVAAKIIDYATDGLGRVGMVTTPNAAELMAKGRTPALVELGVYANRYCFAIFVPMAIFLLSYGKEFLSVWIRPDFAERCAYLLPVLLIGEVIMAGQTNSVSILFGIGRHKVYSRWLLAEAMLVVAGLVLVLPHWGLYGVVWVRSILMAAVRGVALCWLVSRELGVDPLTYASRIYSIPALAAAFVLAVLFGLKYSVLAGRNWPELIAAAAIMCALYVPLVFRFALAPHHREMALGKLREIMGKRANASLPA
jgi:O-antigen/teichoic acid export membrane protein